MGLPVTLLTVSPERLLLKPEAIKMFHNNLGSKCGPGQWTPGCFKLPFIVLQYKMIRMFVEEMQVVVLAKRTPCITVMEDGSVAAERGDEGKINDECLRTTVAHLQPSYIQLLLHKDLKSFCGTDVSLPVSVFICTLFV